MQLKYSKVLVTGGAGFIGSHLVDALAECREVRVLDDLTTGSLENMAESAGRVNFRFLKGDVRDASVVAAAVQGIDVVFHLACRGVRHSLGHPQENHEVNATGTLQLLRAASRVGVARFIHVSSSEVYGTALYAPMDEHHPCLPETVYGAAKLAGESYSRAYHRTYGLPTVIVRPFNNFGPRSHFEGDSGEVIPRFCAWMLNGQRPVIFGDGLQTRDFIYVEDTAHWLCRVAECDSLIGRTVNLGSGAETSIIELARLVGEAVGRIDLEPVFEEARPGDVRRHCGDATLARDALGFQTRVEMAVGIRRLVGALRSHPNGLAHIAQSIQRRNWQAAA